MDQNQIYIVMSLTVRQSRPVPLGGASSSMRAETPQGMGLKNIYSPVLLPPLKKILILISDTRVSDFPFSRFSDWKVDKGICLNL